MPPTTTRFCQAQKSLLTQSYKIHPYILSRAKKLPTNVLAKHSQFLSKLCKNITLHGHFGFKTVSSNIILAIITER